MATDLICPKCQGHMRTYERSGWQRIHSAPRDRDYERERDYERGRDRGSSFPIPFGGDDDDDRRRYSQGSHRKRKKSFFDELFD